MMDVHVHKMFATVVGEPAGVNILVAIDAGLSNTGVSFWSESMCFGGAALLTENNVRKAKTIKKKGTKTRLEAITTAQDYGRRVSEIVNFIKHLPVNWSNVIDVVIESPTGGSKSAKATAGMALALGAIAATIDCIWHEPPTLMSPMTCYAAIRQDLKPSQRKKFDKKDTQKRVRNYIGCEEVLNEIKPPHTNQSRADKMIEAIADSMQCALAWYAAKEKLNV